MARVKRIGCQYIFENSGIVCIVFLQKKLLLTDYSTKKKPVYSFYVRGGFEPFIIGRISFDVIILFQTVPYSKKKVHFIKELLEELLEEQVTFPLYRGVVVDAIYRY